MIEGELCSLVRSEENMFDVLAIAITTYLDLCFHFARRLILVTICKICCKRNVLENYCRLPVEKNKLRLLRTTETLHVAFSNFPFRFWYHKNWVDNTINVQASQTWWETKNVFFYKNLFHFEKIEHLHLDIKFLSTIRKALLELK